MVQRRLWLGRPFTTRHTDTRVSFYGRPPADGPELLSEVGQDVFGARVNELLVPVGDYQSCDVTLRR